MKLKLEQVPRVVNGALYGAIAIALILIVANYYVAGTIVAAVVVALNQAMKRDSVKVWVIATLTGTPREEVLKMDQGHKAQDGGEDTDHR